MKRVIFSVVSVFLLVIVIFYSWRYASNKRELPCPSWLRWFVELDNPFTKYNRADVIIQHTNIKRGMHVIDVGCGLGRLTIPLSKHVGPHGKVTAIDLQAEMIQRAKQKAKEKQLANIEFIQGKIGAGTLQLAPCDRAMLVTVLGEILDQHEALKEIFHALKPGGTLTVTEVIFDPHFQKRETVLKLAKKVGFQEQNFFGHWAAYSMILEKPFD